MGLSLWIVPPERDVPQLKQLMNPPPSIKLPYALPVFDPHITLGTVPSSIPLSLLRSAIPTLTEPLLISFKSLEAGDHFFRSVFIDIVKTRQLESLHANVQSALLSPSAEEGPEEGGVKGITFKSPRFPHLSLFYIPDAHAADRERIRGAFWESGLVTARKSVPEGIAFEIKGDINAEPSAPLEGFVASEIWIASCEGPTEEWKIVEKVPLVR